MLTPPPEKPLQKLVVVIAVLLSAAFNAYSATLTVINSNDTGAGSLRQTIANANNGDTIIFAPNVNYITLTSGEIAIIENFTISGGSGNARVTIDGNNNSRIFRAPNSGNNDVTININNLTLTRGKSIDNGGAIIVGTTNRIIARNCDFIANSAAANGGAVHIASRVVNFVFTFDATNCIFSKNTSDGIGGAIYAGTVSNRGAITANNCTFTENSAINNGGAVYIVGFTFTATNCTFNENSVTYYGGGAVLNDVILQTSGIFTAINCTFNKNTADFGGAIYTVSNSYSYLYHCTFDGNQAPNGNAINTNGTLYSYNCIYTGNTPQIVGTISGTGVNLIEGVNATRNPIFGTNLFNGHYITPLPFAKSAEQLDNTIQVPPGMSVDEILNKLATDQIGNPRPID